MNSKDAYKPNHGLPCCGHKLAQHVDPEFSGFGNTTRCRCCRESPPMPMSCGYCRRIEGHEAGCPLGDNGDPDPSGVTP